MSFYDNIAEAIQAAQSRGRTTSPFDGPVGALSPSMSYPTGGDDGSALAAASMGMGDAPFGAVPVDPYAELDRKQKEALARKLAAGVFDTGAPPVPEAAISGQQVATPAQTGAPFSMAPPQPGVPPSVQLAAQMSPPPPAPAGGPPGGMPTQAPITGLNAPIGGARPGMAPPPAGPAPVVAADDGEEDTPAKAPTDVSARRRGQPMSIAGPAAAPAAAASPFSMDRIGDALLGFGGALQGDRGAMTEHIIGQRQALGMQGQQQNATADLLAAKGATPAEIKAARVAGPDATKALLAEYLGKDKFKVVQTGENERGQKTFQLLNEHEGTFKPVPGGNVAANSASDAAAAAGVTGDQFLSTVPSQQDRSLVKQLVKYDLDPGKLSAKNGNRERLIALAEQYDPDYKAALYAPRAASLKEFTSGGPNAPASIITNGNTAIQHLGRMSELADKLGGTNKAWLANGLVNWANVTLEDMKNNPDLARYKSAQDRFVEEATKFYRGVGGNKSDIDRALELLKPGQSPEARQQAIQEQAELMQSKVNALQDRYKSAVGPSGWKKAMDMAGAEFPVVQQHSADALDSIRKRASGGALPPAASAAAAAAPVVASKPDYDKLPKGTPYIAPDGSHRIKQ